jgi:hypothetical protein
MKRSAAVLVAVSGGAALWAAVALAASSPSVVTGGASKVGQKTAVLAGKLNPNGSPTTYYFQWGLTTGYGAVSRSHSVRAGTKALSVHITAGALIPGTRYHYRIVAYSKFGASAGADRTFKTGGVPLPLATTGPATAVGANFATLTGVVNPNGATTAWTFEYGPNTAYGSVTATQLLSAASAPQTVSVTIPALASGRVFHYQLLASHSGFPAQGGGDQVFMTKPVRPPRPRLAAHTAPRRSRHRPFIFSTSGHIVGPHWIPAGFACSGTVRVRVFFGRRQVAFSLATVQPTCSFATQTVVTRKPGHGRKHRRVRLRVFVHYLGNGYLGQSRARPESVVVG